MLRVALTGGVASGKSAVADMLRMMGAQVSQSDEVGRGMMEPGKPVFAAICDHFGPSVVAADGRLDRAGLARIAFQQGRVEELNAIVHPAVIAAQARWIESVGAADPLAVAVVESALIFETKHGASGPLAPGTAPWRSRFDRIVVVTAPLEERRARYLSRAWTRPAAEESADFEQRCAAQWTDAQKAALADFVLLNDGTLAQLQARVATLYRELQREAADQVVEAM